MDHCLLFAETCKHQFSPQSSIRVNFHGKWLFQLWQHFVCVFVPLCTPQWLHSSVPPASARVISLLWCWDYSGDQQDPGSTHRWDRDDSSHHVLSCFNPSLLSRLKVAQTADYMSTTAGEEVTHHTVEIRLNKLFLGCVRLFNPNMEICLSWPSLGWIRRLQTALLWSLEITAIGIPFK